MGHMKEYLAIIQERGFKDLDKYICPKCVENVFVQDWIQNSADTETTCSYCGKKTKCLHMEKFLEFLMDIIRFYFEPAEGNLAYDSEEQEYLGETYDKYDIVYKLSEKLGIDFDSMLAEDMKKAFNDFFLCNKNPYGTSQLEFCENSWKRFAHLVKYKTRYLFYADDSKCKYEKAFMSASEMLDYATSYLEKLNLFTVLKPNVTFKRARIVENNLEITEEEMASPPYYQAKNNRMTAEGISAFYGTFEDDVAKEEAINKEKDLTGKKLVIADFINLNELKCLDLTKILELTLPDWLDIKRAREREVILFYIYLHKALSSPIKKSDTKNKNIEYVPTQIFAEYAKEILKVDGIIYSSSVYQNGKCIVLFVGHEACLSPKKNDIITFENKQKLKLVSYKVFDL